MASDPKWPAESVCMLAVITPYQSRHGQDQVRQQALLLVGLRDGHFVQVDYAVSLTWITVVPLNATEIWLPSNVTAKVWKTPVEMCQAVARKSLITPSVG